MPGNGTMTDEEHEDYYLRCICSTSVDYAKYYINRASIETLKRCLEEIEGRGASITLRRLLMRRIAKIEKEADYGALS